MTEKEETEALTALLAAARGQYDCAERWKLSRAEVMAFVRGLLAARPDLSVDELRELAGRAGVPTSVLVRVGQGGPAAATRRPSSPSPTASSSSPTTCCATASRIANSAATTSSD